MKMAMKNILQNPQAEVVELELEGVVLEVVAEDGSSRCVLRHRIQSESPVLALFAGELYA